MPSLSFKNQQHINPQQTSKRRQTIVKEKEEWSSDPRINFIIKQHREFLNNYKIQRQASLMSSFKLKLPENLQNSFSDKSQTLGKRSEDQIQIIENSLHGLDHSSGATDGNSVILENSLQSIKHSRQSRQQSCKIIKDSFGEIKQDSDIMDGNQQLEQVYWYKKSNNNFKKSESMNELIEYKQIDKNILEIRLQQIIYRVSEQMFIIRQDSKLFGYKLNTKKDINRVLKQEIFIKSLIDQNIIYDQPSILSIINPHQRYQSRLNQLNYNQSYVQNLKKKRQLLYGRLFFMRKLENQHKIIHQNNQLKQLKSAQNARKFARRQQAIQRIYQLEEKWNHIYAQSKSHTQEVQQYSPTHRQKIIDCQKLTNHNSPYTNRKTNNICTQYTAKIPYHQSLRKKWGRVNSQYAIEYSSKAKDSVQPEEDTKLPYIREKSQKPKPIFDLNEQMLSRRDGLIATIPKHSKPSLFDDPKASKQIEVVLEPRRQNIQRRLLTYND